MTAKTDALHQKILNAKKARLPKSARQELDGYNFMMSVLSMLFACLFVSTCLGIFIYKFFNTSSVVIAIFVIMGGIAGLYSLIKMILQKEKDEQNV